MSTQRSLELLNQQKDALARLLLLLDTELQQISSRDAEALISLVKEKEVLLEQIQQQDEQLSTLLPSELTEQQTTLKEQIIDLVKDCQYRTQINATAVEQGQLRLEHLRNLIVESRAKESLTYDKAGKKHSGSRGSGISA
ncbi:flagellar export chaperone FlgN [Bowmanella yangjiangensis]|uniref:Flagellar export chaperone FlgN n=1 Tax=Bowmanella yangjiangensis TaxID=2811230 RepID=A0ABS3CT56_9ALTE|nr:flagellar export chaperone FlgN [Bowmanella yangjiangensis]